MGDKEIKSWLKEAREHIKLKEYKNALKECKKVLHKDKSNYLGLVFCGLALSELDQPDHALQVSPTPCYGFSYNSLAGLQARGGKQPGPGGSLGGSSEIL